MEDFNWRDDWQGSLRW